VIIQHDRPIIYTPFSLGASHVRKGCRGPKVKNMLRLDDKFCQKYFHFEKKMAIKKSFFCALEKFKLT